MKLHAASPGSIGTILSGLAALAALALIAAAPLAAQDPAGEAGAAALGPLPASFSGRLRFRDWKGTRYQLNLLPDQTFLIVATNGVRDDSAPTGDIGRWSLTDGETTLLLSGSDHVDTRFRIGEGPSLLKLEPEGEDLGTAPDNTLRRAERFTPVEPRLDLTGMYRFMADAGMFRECRTGLRWPVAHEAANATLEREYGAIRGEPGEAVMVGVLGRIALRPRMEGSGQELTLVVDRVEMTMPEEVCGEPVSPPPLEGTTWRLTRLNARPLDIREPERRPRIVLDAKEHRVAGSGGCNRITGGYTLDGEDLAFGRIASTMMACDDMEIERSFLEALGRARRWTIAGVILDLYDGDGIPLARFRGSTGVDPGVR